MSYSLNSLKGGYIGDYIGTIIVTIIGLTKGDTRSLHKSSIVPTIVTLGIQIAQCR